MFLVIYDKHFDKIHNRTFFPIKHIYIIYLLVCVHNTPIYRQTENFNN